MSRAQNSLDGKWVLITGAAKRIGACFARTLHDAGANVALHYRGSVTPATALADELNKLRADSAITVEADLLDMSAVKSLVGRVVEQTGRLDVLVNNASSFYPTALRDVTEENWNDLIGTNLKAPLFLCQAAEPHLKAVNGCIVNMIDVHATRPLRDHAVYGAAKAGLAMLTRSLARDLAPDIRVNGVSPGAILWPESGLSDGVKNSIVKQIPLRRVGEPEDLADCLLYLVRDANYVTGQIIAIDGGRSIGW